MYVISRHNFLELIHNYPSMSVQLLNELSRRIHASDQQIEDLALGDARSRVFPRAHQGR